MIFVAQMYVLFTFVAGGVVLRWNIFALDWRCNSAYYKRQTLGVLNRTSIEHMDFTTLLLLGYCLAGLICLRLSVIPLLAVVAYWAVLLLQLLTNFTAMHTHTLLWSSRLGLQLSFNLDGLARLFITLIAAISIAIFIYAYLYFKDKPSKRTRLMALLQLFGVSMVGAVASDNMIALFLFWEMTTVVSYCLIQFNYSDDKSNQLAFNAMFVSVVGGFCLLAAVLLIAIDTDTLSLTASMASLAQHQVALLPLFVLILVAAMTKSAQFPFQFWLAGAMKAPTPVSAYLHSATMVNLGIYLLARFHCVFAAQDYWYASLTNIGLITMLLSAVVSMMKNDMKKILAYTTVFSLGLMVYLLGSSDWLAIDAMFVFLLFHGIYKSGLFMLVGAIDKQFGTRDVKQLVGVARRNGWLGFSAFVLLLAMAGLPPFFGFAMKEMIYEAKLSSPSLSVVMVGLGLLSSALLAAASMRCLYYLFKKPTSKVAKTAMPAFLWLPVVMSVLVLLMWLIEVQLSQPIAAAVFDVLRTSASHQSTGNWLSTALSVGTVVLGVVLFALYVALKDKLNLSKLFAINGNAVLKCLLTGFVACWKGFSNGLQELSLESKCLIILAAMVACLAYGGVPLRQWLTLYGMAWTPVAVVSVVIMIATTCIVIWSRHIILDAISLSVFGLFLCLLYLYLGAPDVSMTQFLIEILSIVILALVLDRKDFIVVRQRTPFNVWRLLLSIGFGVLAFVVLVTMWQHPQPQQVLNYYQHNSLDQAYGRNIVNVILVDFRSFDTLGEVLVVLGAMVGVYAYKKRLNHES